MSEISFFEAVMLICFGLAWPLNIIKSLRTKSTQGKSVLFLIVILIVMVGHYIWLAVLYGLAGAYSGSNPWEVLRHYGPAYLTAVGTMSEWPWA